MDRNRIVVLTTAVVTANSINLYENRYKEVRAVQMFILVFGREKYMTCESNRSCKIFCTTQNLCIFQKS